MSFESNQILIRRVKLHRRVHLLTPFFFWVQYAVLRTRYLVPISSMCHQYLQIMKHSSKTYNAGIFILKMLPQSDFLFCPWTFSYFSCYLVFCSVSLPNINSDSFTSFNIHLYLSKIEYIHSSSVLFKFC